MVVEAGGHVGAITPNFKFTPADEPKVQHTPVALQSTEFPVANTGHVTQKEKLVRV